MQSDTLERLTPGRAGADGATGLDTVALHLERYRVAAWNARPGLLLDMACGVGYGARLLAECRGDLHHVIGVDVSGAAIAVARAEYAHSRVAFVQADAMAYAAPGLCDTVVSLETIEHMAEPRRFVRQALRSLRAGGRFIASVPVTPSVDANPHHLHDFTAAGFRRLGAGLGLVEVASHLQVQRFDPAAVLMRREARLQDMRSGLLGYYARHPGAAWRRGVSTLRHGFANHYLTVVWEKP